MNKQEKTFGAKLYSMFLISMLIPTIIAMFCFWIYANRLVIKREEKNSQNILNSVSQNLELQFSENDSIRNAYYVYKKVFQEAENLNNPKLYKYYDELTRIDIENNYIVTLTKLLHTSAQDVRAVVFFPVAGEETAYYLGKDSAKIREISYPGYKEEPWYKAVTEDGEDSYYYVSDISEYIPNKGLGEVYSYVTPLINVDNQKIIGVIKMDISKSTLQNTLDALEDSEYTGLMLVQRGNVFAKSSKLGEIEEIKDNQVIAGKRVYQTFTKTVPGTDLEVLYLYSRISIYRELAYVVLLSILIVMSGVVLAFFYYRKQAEKMVSDVQEITTVVHGVENGDLDNHIDIHNDSEFGRIAEVINHMIDSLKEYIEKEYILVIQQQKAEYKALQSQINPHFLYNTLNGFVALNRMGEKKILEKSIVGLSRLFRYACSKKDTSRVREELSFLEDYLKLEKLKYAERLEYMIWVDEECKEKQIPKLLLQPIVENSIKHGMGDTDQPIMIRISAIYLHVKGIGKVMILTVRDNGVGFDNGYRENGNQHIGIGNARTRAELYCKDVIFQCVSKPGKGTKTTFVFPDEE